jgi:hypothetical protein
VSSTHSPIAESSCGKLSNLGQSRSGGSQPLPVPVSHDLRVSPRSKRVKAAAAEQEGAFFFFFFLTFFASNDIISNMADDSYAREEEVPEEEELDETVTARFPILSEYRSRC